MSVPASSQHRQPPWSSHLQFRGFFFFLFLISGFRGFGFRFRVSGFPGRLKASGTLEGVGLKFQDVRVRSEKSRY